MLRCGFTFDSNLSSDNNEMIAVGVEKQNGNLERVDSNMSDFGKVNISFNAMYDDEMPNESNINEITKV